MASATLLGRRPLGSALGSGPVPLKGRTELVYLGGLELERPVAIGRRIILRARTTGRSARSLARELNFGEDPFHELR